MSPQPTDEYGGDPTALVQCPCFMQRRTRTGVDRGLPRSHSMLMAELALEPISPDYQSKASSSWTTQVPPSLAVISRKATPHTHRPLGLCTDTRDFPPAHQACAATFDMLSESGRRPKDSAGCGWHPGEVDLEDRTAGMRGGGRSCDEGRSPWRAH